TSTETVLPATSTEAVLPAGEEAAAATPTEPRRSALGWSAIVVAMLALLAAIYAHTELTAVRKESARRLTDLEQAAVRLNETANRADAEARAARERGLLLEARRAEGKGARGGVE